MMQTTERVAVQDKPACESRNCRATQGVLQVRKRESELFRNTTCVWPMSTIYRGILRTRTHPYCAALYIYSVQGPCGRYWLGEILFKCSYSLPELHGSWCISPPEGKLSQPQCSIDRDPVGGSSCFLTYLSYCSLWSLLALEHVAL